MEEGKYRGPLEGIENPEREISLYPSNKPDPEIDEEFGAELTPKLDGEASLQAAVAELGSCWKNFGSAKKQIKKSYGISKLTVLESILLAGQDKETIKRIDAKMNTIQTVYDKYHNLLTKFRSTSNTITQEQIAELRNALNETHKQMSELDKAVWEMKAEVKTNILNWKRIISNTVLPTETMQYIKEKIEKITGYRYKDPKADYIECIYLNKHDQLVSVKELTDDERKQIIKDHNFNPMKHNLLTDAGGIYIFRICLSSLLKDLESEIEKIEKIESQVKQTKIDMQEEDVFYDAEEDVFYDAAQTPEEMKELYGTDEKRYAEDTGMPQQVQDEAEQVQDEVAAKLNRISKLLKTLRQKVVTIWQKIQNLIKLGKEDPKETREKQEKRDEEGLSRIILRGALESTHTDTQKLNPSEAGHHEGHVEAHDGDHNKAHDGDHNKAHDGHGAHDHEGHVEGHDGDHNKAHDGHGAHDHEGHVEGHDGDHNKAHDGDHNKAHDGHGAHDHEGHVEGHDGDHNKAHDGHGAHDHEGHVEGHDGHGAHDHEGHVEGHVEGHDQEEEGNNKLSYLARLRQERESHTQSKERP